METRICALPGCGKPFQCYPSQVQKYCCNTCSQRSMGRVAGLKRGNAERNKVGVSKIEQAFYTFLTELGIPYQAQYTVKGFQVDAWVEHAQTVIQFQGDRWHGNPERFPVPDSRQRAKIARDRRQRQILERAGYTLIAIWESDFRYRPEQVRERLIHLATTPTTQGE